MGTPPGESAGGQAAQGSNAPGAARSPGSDLLPANDPAATRPTTGPVVPPRPPSAPPSSVIAAVKLMYVGAGLSLLGMVYGLTTRVHTRERLAADDPDQTQAGLDLARGRDPPSPIPPGVHRILRREVRRGAQTRDVAPSSSLHAGPPSRGWPRSLRYRLCGCCISGSPHPRSR